MDKKSAKKKNIFNKEKSAASTAIIASLAYLVLGFIMMLFPKSISDVLCYTLGIVLTVYGLFNIISFFINILLHITFPASYVNIHSTSFT